MFTMPYAITVEGFLNAWQTQCVKGSVFAFPLANTVTAHSEEKRSFDARAVQSKLCTQQDKPWSPKGFVGIHP